MISLPPGNWAQQEEKVMTSIQALRKYFDAPPLDLGERSMYYAH